MWGSNWGEMIWGGNTGLQIPIGPWALVALGFVLGAYAVYTHRNRATHTVPFILILCVPAVAVIAASVPNVFENNTVADATEVNANFNALVSAINSLEDRVATLESALSVSKTGDVSLVGTNVTVKAAVVARLEGVSTEIQAASNLTLNGGTTTSVSGTLVNINGGSLPNARVSDPVQVICPPASGGGSVACTGSIVGTGSVTTLN